MNSEMSVLVNFGFHEFYVGAIKPIPERKPSITGMKPEKDKSHGVFDNC